MSRGPALGCQREYCSRPLGLCMYCFPYLEGSFYNLIVENAHSFLKVLLNMICLGMFLPSLLGEDESLLLWVPLHFLNCTMPSIVRCTIDLIIALGRKETLL